MKRLRRFLLGGAGLLMLCLPFIAPVPTGFGVQTFLFGLLILLALWATELLWSGTLWKQICGGLLLVVSLFPVVGDFDYWLDLPYWWMLRRPVAEGPVTAVTKIPSDAWMAQPVSIGHQPLLKYGAILTQHDVGDQVRVEYLPHSRVIVRWTEQ